jgi:hypothetical protein
MERQRVMWCLALNRSHRWRDTITSRRVQPYGIRQISPDFTFEEGALPTPSTAWVRPGPCLHRQRVLHPS